MDREDRLPSLSALRAFDAAARHLSFSAAARSLNVTHAAIAQQVRALEHDLGTALVFRAGRGIALTEEGTALAAALDEGFGKIRAGVAALAARRLDAPLKVTMTPGFAVQWLMPRLGGFWAAHPDLSVSLMPDEKVVDLRSEGIDLGIRYGNGSWPGVEAEFLTSARYVLVAAPSLVSGIDPHDIAALSALPWLRDQGWREYDRWLQALGFAPEELHFTEFATEELARSAARQGYGLCLESVALIESDLADGTLTIVRDAEESGLGYYIVTPPGPLRHPAQVFRRWLCASV